MNHAGIAAEQPIKIDLFGWAWDVVVAGNSEMMREPHPHVWPYSRWRQRNLFWRCTLFQDQLALWLLRENVGKFYS